MTQTTLFVDYITHLTQITGASAISAYCFSSKAWWNSKKRFGMVHQEGNFRQWFYN